jgi:hypothetical protein
MKITEYNKFVRDAFRNELNKDLYEVSYRAVSLEYFEAVSEIKGKNALFWFNFGLKNTI